MFWNFALESRSALNIQEPGTRMTYRQILKTIISFQFRVDSIRFEIEITSIDEDRDDGKNTNL